MTDKKLDIFQVLNNISTKNVDYYNTLTDDQKKAFAPFVVSRWLSGTSDKRQIVMLNQVVNQFTFNIGQHHKHLMYLLMTICTSGKTQRYAWNKLPGKATTSKPLTVNVIARYFGYSTKHAKQALPLLSPDDIIDYAFQLGIQADEITKIKKELKSA